MVEDKFTGEDRPPKPKGRPPIGTASLARGTSYVKVGGVFFSRKGRHPLLVVKADDTFTITKQDALMIFLNATDYRVVLLKKGTIMGL